MDSRNRVQKVFVDKQTDLSKWMQGILQFTLLIYVSKE